jgi:hypothetical protein
MSDNDYELFVNNFSEWLENHKVIIGGKLRNNRYISIIDLEELKRAILVLIYTDHDR